jgi:hypothetical protein
MMSRLTVPLLLLAACSTRSEPVVVAGNYHDVVDVPPEPVGKIDLLFVVDNSNSIGDDQLAIASNARQAFFDVIAQGHEGVLPDLHIALVTTDMGAGGSSFCPDPDGDNGRFQGPFGPTCPAADGSFLVDEDDGEGGLVGPRGVGGCGFEQPFAAVQRALDGTHAEHAGFLRDDALLAVVFLTDEDDCSVLDTDIFDDAPNHPTLPSPGVRCFAAGVVCDQAPAVAGSPGVYSECRAREDSADVQPVQDTVDFLKGLKDDPTQVMVITIAGQGDTVELVSDSNDWVRPVGVCGEPDGEDFTYPAFRMDALVEAFSARSSQANICDDVVEGLQKNAAAMASVTGQKGCLTRVPADADAALAGLQPDCRAFDVSAPLTESERRTEIRSCAATGGQGRCFEVGADPACIASGTGLSARLQNGSPDSDRHFVVSCLLD